MLTRSKNVENIIIKLSLLHYYVRMRSKLGYVDINKDCENVFCEIFNEVYGLRLENLNKKVKNHAAIDLGDGKKKVAYQITSDNDKSKITDTVNMFELHKLDKNYKELNIFIIGEKKKYKTLPHPKGYKLLVTDLFELLDEIGMMEQDRIKKIAELVNKQIDDQFLQIQAESKDYFAIKMYNSTSFTNARSFLSYVFQDDSVKDSVIRKYLDDIRSLQSKFNKIEEKTRRLLSSLISLREDDGSESIRILNEKVSVDRFDGVTPESLKKHINLLINERLISPCEIYIESYQCELEGVKVHFGTNQDWSLLYLLVEYLSHEKLNKLIIELDFSVLD